jgi:GDSL-like Lipase/Acylhydrolase family
MDRDTFDIARRFHLCGLFLALSLGMASAQRATGEPASPAARNELESMQQVHARFTGQPGTFAQFGDSITVTMAFWAPLPQARKNASSAMEKAFKRVSDSMRAECWREWKGPSFGSDGSKTIQWAHEHIDEWLRTLNPEVALVMFGSNDVHAMKLEEYQTTLRAVVRKCLANGTIVILSTAPPQSGFVEKGASFAEAVRQIARELNVPLIDFHAEIMKRRPDDWDGSLPKFAQWDGYDVPTLIARDGVHPSLPKQFANDYSDEALNNCGYSLRNFLVLMKYADVIERILKANPGKTAR